MRNKKIVIGNWKMNPESVKLAESLFKGVVKNNFSKVSVVICPPFLYLNNLKKISKKISLGVQNVASEERGAFTGEISALMSYDTGARYTILGHSERRDMGENDLMINKKVKLALLAGLVPILCVGEKERDEAHEYFQVIKNQIEESLAGISKNSISKIIIAYEPVWAIGKNAIREATPEEFREVAVFIKKVLSDKFGGKEVGNMSILYGGSVNPKNTSSFLTEGGADGFLVGGASLDVKKFSEIIKICTA